MTSNISFAGDDDRPAIPEQDFTFDAVFDECRDLVQSAADGYKVTTHVYGQTGAGNTFTMYGASNVGGTAAWTIEEV